MNVLTRGTVTIAVDRCKGASCASPRAHPTCSRCRTTSTRWASAYPVLHPGCTGCQACQVVCPDWVFTVFRYEEPIELDDAMTEADDHERSPSHGGLGGDGRGRDRRRLPLLRRVPDDAVHRAARALREASSRSRRGVRERRERARSGGNVLGRARPPARAPPPAPPARGSRSCRSRSPRPRSPGCPW